MEQNDFDAVARRLFNLRLPLNPLTNDADVPAFNTLREVAAELCELWDGVHPGVFDYERFMTLAMTGRLP